MSYILYKKQETIVIGAVKITSTPLSNLDGQYHMDIEGGDQLSYVLVFDVLVDSNT